MKLKVKHFDAKIFESKMDHLKDVNFTLFVDEKSLITVDDSLSLKG